MIDFTYIRELLLFIALLGTPEPVPEPPPQWPPIPEDSITIHLRRISYCESHDIPTVISGNETQNPEHRYYGLFQFSLATWRVVGGIGLPSDASVEEQWYRARLLYTIADPYWQWPYCSLV